MTFKNLDFGADKAAQYSAVRETMAAIYCDDFWILREVGLHMGWFCEYWASVIWNF